MKNPFVRLALAAALGSLLISTKPLLAQDTAFTYQGQLSASGSPASGNYDFQFSLYPNAAGTGSPLGTGTLTQTAIGVSNGLFTTTLNFGAVFPGNATWLAISVRSNNVGSYTGLTPLQELTPTPYAIFANTASNLSGTVSAASVSGTLLNGQLANNSVTVNAGTGLGGGGAVALGGSTTLNNAGVLSVTGNADITAATVGGAVTLGDTATSANTASTIVKRDGTGSFSADNLTLNDALALPALSGTSSNAIYSGSILLLYADTHQNFFSGQGAGNLTTGGAGGVNNMADGFGALSNNTSGSYNAASGAYALYENTSGTGNTANGDGALYDNKGGFYNTASGYNALVVNSSGSDNTASGANALVGNTSGTGNTAIGMFALNNNTNGSYNIALGYQAGGNITSGNSNIDIGNAGLATDTNIIRIGTNQTTTYIAGTVNGNGGGLTNLSAAQLSGTISLAQLPGSVVTNNSTNVNLTGSFAGNGGGLTNLNASQLTSGTISLAQLPGAVVTNNSTNVNLTGSFAGNGAGVTNVSFGLLNTDGDLSWGTFALSSSLALATQPESICAAVLSGNGYVDLVSASSSAGTLTVLTNNGSGVFGSNATLTGITAPQCVIAAPLTSNGFMDLVCADLPNTLTVLTNNGNGVFAVSSTLTVGTNPDWVCAADVNGDGHIDLICANAGNGTSAGTLTVLTNNGIGGFVLSSTLTVGVFPSSVTAADVNGDGHVDLICANLGNQTSAGTLTVLTNNGSGGFALSSSPVVGIAPRSITAADVNGDGNVDLICANSGSGTLTVLTNNGSGGFVLSATLTTGIELVVAADVNGDGHVDLIGANPNAVLVFLNEPAYKGGFTGNGSGLTSLNASQLTSGTIPLAQLPPFNSLTLAGDLTLPAITASTPDIIYSGSVPLLYCDYSNNLFGGFAGNSTLSGSNNTAYGNGALASITSGSYNTASGEAALLSNLSGSNNTAYGSRALQLNTTGCGSAAVGFNALYFSASGSNNVAIGYQALYALGSETDLGGNADIALGYQAGISYQFNESSNILIGNPGISGENNTIHIGTEGVQTTATIAGNVGIGTNSPGELLEVAGPNAAIRVRKKHDQVGGFMGNTYYALQLGMYNPTNITEGLLSAGEKRSYFGFAYQTGQVGSLSSDYGPPTFRNVLDDGSGNLTVTGKVGIGNGTSTPANLLVVGNSGSPAYCNGTTWVNGSDRNSKEAFAAINPRTVLEKVSALPITEWKYKVEADGTRHLGPVAQDFHSAFGLNGADDKHIATVDEEGVALAAIQGLNQKVVERDARIQQQGAEIQKLNEKADKVDSLEKQNDVLTARLNDLEATVKQLVAQK
jgi:hypothetical protein